MKDRDFVYCEVRQEAPGGLYIIYGESLSDDKVAQVWTRITLPMVSATHHVILM